MTATDIKALVRARDGFRCVQCGMTNDRHRERYGRQLDVHRTEPGSPYSADGCVTLCKGCHAGQPKRRRGEPDRSSGRPVHRLSFDADSEPTRRAVYLAAASRGVSHGELLNDLVRQYLGEYLVLARKAIEDEEPPPPKKKG